MTCAKRFGFLLLLALGWACSFNPLRVQEVLEGSDAWVRELVKDMHISAEYSREGQVGKPWLFVIRIENLSKYEPHLNTISVEFLPERPRGGTCDVLTPRLRTEKLYPSSFLYFLEPTRVRYKESTEIRLQCLFPQPGQYNLLITASFRESSVAFFSQRIEVSIR